MPGSRSLSDRNIVEDVIALLEYYQALGIERLPLDLAITQAPPVGTVPSAASLQREAGHEATGTGKLHREGHVAPSGEKTKLLALLREEIGDCTRCTLSCMRKNIVFGEGNSDARLMFIGEGPGEEEDIQARPFVGKAGILLTRLIEKMELQRSDVYIANIVKCRPPENREPETAEVAICKPFLEQQIEIIRPSVIVTLGNVALQALLNNPSLRITASRGHFVEYRGIPVMPTFHPAYLLRNPADKWKTWADAQKALERMHTGRS
ncbi:MAG: uracil-DNA glycosylase [Thermodesulfovibrionales bacterium]